MTSSSSGIQEPSPDTPPMEADVAVIGAGPVGLFSVFQCGMLGMRCAVIDALPDIGGQCTALYPEKPIFDIAGFPRVEAASLIAQLEQQAAPFAPAYHLHQQVTDLTRTADERWLLTTSRGTRLLVKTVFIAAGAGAFGPNRPPLDGIEAYEGQSVFYAVRRREDFAGRRIVIAGGGDSAVDWALSLQGVAARVIVVHRRDKFRAMPEPVNQLRKLAAEDRLDLVTPYQLHALEGDGSRLSAVVLRSLDGEQKTVPADVLLPFFGLSTDLGPIRDWDLALERQHIAVDPASCQTSQPGIFAIGDVATYPGKLKLIVNGFGEAATAAHAAYARVFPGQALHFEYSTNKGVPDAPRAAGAA